MEIFTHVLANIDTRGCQWLTAPSAIELALNARGKRMNHTVGVIGRRVRAPAAAKAT